MDVELYQHLAEPCAVILEVIFIGLVVKLSIDLVNRRFVDSPPAARRLTWLRHLDAITPNPISILEMPRMQLKLVAHRIRRLKFAVKLCGPPFMDAVVETSSELANAMEHTREALHDMITADLSIGQDRLAEELLRHPVDLLLALQEHLRSVPFTASLADLDLFELAKAWKTKHDAVAAAATSTAPTNATGTAASVKDHIIHTSISHAILGHIPWITLVASLFREVPLVASGKTWTTRAMKNVAIDTGFVAAGIGAGQLIGGPAATALATAFVAGSSVAVPIIGGVIASVLLGIVGNLCAGSMRLRPFKQARETYLSAAESAEDTVRIAADRGNRASEDLETRTRNEFEQGCEKIHKIGARDLQRAASTTKAVLTEIETAFPMWLHAVERQLQRERQFVLLRYRRPWSWFTRAAARSTPREVVELLFAAQVQMLTVTIFDFETLNRQEDRWEFIQRWVRTYEFHHPDFACAIQRLASNTERAQLEKKVVIERVRQQQEQLGRDLATKHRAGLADICAIFLQDTEPRLKALVGATDRLKREALAAGFELEAAGDPIDAATTATPPVDSTFVFETA